MNENLRRSEKTVKLLTAHYKAYPKMQIEDVFKYLFQSAFGCEHLVSDASAALDYIKSEYETQSKTESPKTEVLDGEYSRAYLSWLNVGLKAETLATLFCLSAKKESNGRSNLEQKLEIARNLIKNGDLPFDETVFENGVEEWSLAGYPAIRHSDVFRSEYHPSYRVIAKGYADFLPLFAKIDGLLDKGNAIIAIEGGSASGKTTLSGILKDVYDCNVFHTDDFFLRPAQRTPERLAEIGGNLDRERFYDEIVVPLRSGEAVCFRPFDCGTQALGEQITATAKKLTVVEGVYSAHPAFGKYFDLLVFLDIDPEYQKQRIIERNAPRFAERFFNEWIPLENAYFSGTDIKKHSDLTFKIISMNEV